MILGLFKANVILAQTGGAVEYTDPISAEG